MLRSAAERAHGLAGRVRLARLRARVRYAALRAGAHVELDLHPAISLEAVPEVYVLGGSHNRLAIGAGVAVGTAVRLELRGGRLEIGAGSTVRHGCRLGAAGALTIGPGVLLSSGVHLHCAESVTIGADTACAEHVTIADSDHLRTPPGEPVHHSGASAPVVLGSNIWVGAKATIVKGVTVGDQAFVGANAVVTRDVEAWWLVAGNPAVPIRRLEPAV